jgi:hypothetical protein
VEKGTGEPVPFSLRSIPLPRSNRIFASVAPMDGGGDKGVGARTRRVNDLNHEYGMSHISMSFPISMFTCIPVFNLI